MLMISMCRATRSRASRALHPLAPLLLALASLAPPLPAAVPPDRETPLRTALEEAKQAIVEDASQANILAAVELLRRLLDQSPTDADALRVDLAEHQLLMLDIERAEKTIETIGRETDTSALRARIAEYRDERDSALALYGRHLQTAPDDADAWSRVAALERARDNLPASIEARTRLVQLGDTPGNRLERAEVLLAARRWDDALADADAANRLAPADPQVKRIYPKYERIRKALDQIKSLQATIEQDPKNLAALIHLGALLLGTDQPALAAQDLRRAHDLQPHLVAPVILLARALNASGKQREAATLRYMTRSRQGFTAENLQRLLNLDERRIAAPDDPEALYQQAWILNEEQQYLLALDVATRLHSPPNNDPRGLAEAAFATDRLGESRKALDLARRATDANPKSANAWRVRGEIEMHRADFPAAIDSLSRSLTLERSPDVLAMRERCYRVTGQGENAERDRKAIEQAR